MTDPALLRLRAREPWLNDSTAEAERLLPDLLDLPAGVLRSACRQRRELRTAGMMKCLLDLAHDALDRSPERAHALATIVVELIPFVSVPADMTSVVRTLQAEAWMDYASILHAMGRLAQAHRAIGTARELLERTSVSGWYFALAALVEGPIVHDLGAREAGLAILRGAAGDMRRYRDHKRFADARLTEASMLQEAGDHTAATGIWLELLETAGQRRDAALMAHIQSRGATLHLRHGDPGTAVDLLVSALANFESQGLHRDAVRTRWRLAGILSDQGRTDHALKELRTVFAQLLSMKNFLDAALAAMDMVEVLLASGREMEVPEAAATLAARMGTGLRPNALAAFEYLGATAAAGELTAERVADVRQHLDDLRHWPNKGFRTPE